MTNHEPLTPELLDELLSAELDGELETAARDLGVDPEEIAGRIAATPGAESRRRALAAGSASLAVEPLDDVTRQRLLGAVRAGRESADAIPASGAGTSAARSRQWQRVLAVAAALLVVVGVASVIVSLGDEDGSDDTAADAPESADELGDVAGEGQDVQQYARDVADPENLERLLRGPAGAASQDDGAAETSASVPAASEDGEPAPTDGERFTLRSSAVETCLTQFAAHYDAARVDRLYSAPHDGRPALVVVTDLDGRKSVVVYDPVTCTTLEFQSLPGS
jgi:hypothetical protein